MPRIDIYGNSRQSTKLNELRRFFEALTLSGSPENLHVDNEYLLFLREVIPDIAARLKPIDAASDPAPSLALSIGGDGTFLTTANRIGGAGTPIMGINSGHLGYLSAADIAQADALAGRIVSGEFSVEPRTLLQVCSESPLLPPRPFALNEVAILKQATASMITVETRLNGHLLASVGGDGLIVSTPTGSTGYNLSVGGPVVSPNSTEWILSPVAPHSLYMRPLVVDDSSVFTVRVRSRSGFFMLAIDGRSTSLPEDTELVLRKAPFRINVAHLPGQNFIDTLRYKLHWGIDK